LPGILATDRLAVRPADQDSASADQKKSHLHFRRHSGRSILVRVDFNLHAARRVAVVRDRTPGGGSGGQISGCVLRHRCGKLSKGSHKEKNGQSNFLSERSKLLRIRSPTLEKRHPKGPPSFSPSCRKTCSSSMVVLAIPRAWQMLDRNRARCAPAAHAAPIPALPHVIEATLNHTIPGVAGVYRQHNFVEEKKAALEGLATLVLDIVGPTSD